MSTMFQSRDSSAANSPKSLFQMHQAQNQSRLINKASAGQRGTANELVSDDEYGIQGNCGFLSKSTQ